MGFLLGSQSRLVAAALRGSVEEVEQMLRESSVADMNPLVSLRSAGLPHHEGVAHWPLRALLAAGCELSSDSEFRLEEKAAGHPANVRGMGVEACSTVSPGCGWVGSGAV